jgi:hypothetical protein
MTALELAHRLHDLVAQHGNLHVMHDSESTLLELDRVHVFNAPYLEQPIFLVSPSEPLEKASNSHSASC